ncbi:MAG: 2-C-methyl-D-erythritol 4-phosphate cytidylyltransferase [Firmicutes bacterium]|nr:2-C-methyl-D-erythritol 4-phosphate cytidylyltransferase [Bacillota bacterium]
MNILLLMMGGSGTRFGADIPKQYIELENRPIFSYILEAHQNCPLIDRIVVVSHESWIQYVESWVRWLEADKVSAVVAGGANRSGSVRNGLCAMHDWASPEDVVLIHDATHPYCDVAGIGRIVEAVKTYGGATLGQPQFDTVYRTNGDGFVDKVIPRQLVISGASPEAFRYQEIYDIYDHTDEAEMERMTSAGAIALAHNIPMKAVDSEVLNLKITYPHDFALLKVLLHNYFPNAKPCSEAEKPV